MSQADQAAKRPKQRAAYPAASRARAQFQAGSS